MPRNKKKSHRNCALGQTRNANGQFADNQLATPVATIDLLDVISDGELQDDSIEECSISDDIDNRERGWHSEQDDNGSASADDSEDEFDEESVSEDHDFSRDEDFQTAISAIGSASDEDSSDSDLEESSILRSSGPWNFLTWKKGADKGPIGNKMLRGSSRMTKWRHDTKAKEEKQRIKRVRTDQSFAKVDVLFSSTDDGPSSDAEDHIIDTVAMLNKLPEEKLLDLAIEKLGKIVQPTKKRNYFEAFESTFTFEQHKSVFRYLKERRDNPTDGKMASSQKIAEAVFEKESAFSHKARCIRVWSEDYLRSHKFAPCKQGKYTKIPTIITDEQVQQKLLVYGLEKDFSFNI